MASRLHLTIAPEKRESFLKAVWQWHLMAKCIGWKALTIACEKDFPQLRGKRRLRRKKIKRSIKRFMMDELEQAGLKVERSG